MNIDKTSSSTRVIINTGAQYVRSIISLFVALYSTRLILNALGVNDYGIYSLIAGVVAMLSFISNALVSTTQRFISYHQTNSTKDFISTLFGNIVILHIVFSIALVLILEVAQPFLFNGFLNIEPSKISAAKYVYQCAIFMVTISFLYAPFVALLISHENIVYSSIVQVVDSLFRLAIAISISYFADYKLETYVTLLCLISIFDILAYGIYSFRKYDECVCPRLHHLRKSIFKKIAGFLTWQIYSAGCVVGRTQGTAIVLNKFYGTFLNASFGIAQQVSGAISFVSSSLLNAINPQIIKAEGDGNRRQMFTLSMAASKFSLILLAMFVTPLIFNMNLILHLWLKEVPEYAVLFCQVILLTSFFDQTTSGLITANQAIGNVRSYSLVINTIKLLTVPIIAIMIFHGTPLKVAFWVYAFVELICAISRLPFLKITGGLKILEFTQYVFVRLLIPIVFIFLINYYLSQYISNLILLIACTILTSVVYLMLVYWITLTYSEKDIVKNISKKILKVCV